MTAYRDPSWGFWSKAALVAVVLGIMWALVPSSTFIKPINMMIVKDAVGRWVVISEREIPWGPVTAVTQADIQVLGRPDGLTCSQTFDSLFLRKPNNVSRYDISEWASDCMESGPPISATFRRTVWLFDMIPLRPVDYSFAINPENAPTLETEILD